MRQAINFLIVAFAMFGIACERVVDIQETDPELIAYCDTEPTLLGSWFSDSVHIVTSVDTIDSLIINRRPTLSYTLDINCGDSSLFLLSYTNFAGVRTDDIHSGNFTAQSGQIYVFNAFDAEADTNTAGFHARYSLSNDSLGVFRFQQQPNPGQLTRYTLFMKKAS